MTDEVFIEAPEHVEIEQHSQDVVAVESVEAVSVTEFASDIVTAAQIEVVHVGEAGLPGPPGKPGRDGLAYAYVGPLPPSSPTQGVLWVDTSDNNKLKVYNIGQWVYANSLESDGVVLKLSDW